MFRVGETHVPFGNSQRDVFQLNRDKTVAILGSSKSASEAPENAGFLIMAKELAKDLTSKGYNVLTGGNMGINEAASKGAWAQDPSKSFAVEVTSWKDEHKSKIFNTLAEVKTGAERTDLFRKLAKFWVIFPGGPGTLQELSVGGESKYYKVNDAPEMILVGKKFQQPLFDYFQNMNSTGVAKNPEKSYKLADSKGEILDYIVGEKLNLVA